MNCELVLSISVLFNEIIIVTCIIIDIRLLVAYLEWNLSKSDLLLWLLNYWINFCIIFIKFPSIDYIKIQKIKSLSKSLGITTPNWRTLSPWTRYLTANSFAVNVQCKLRGEKLNITVSNIYNKQPPVCSEHTDNIQACDCDSVGFRWQKIIDRRWRSRCRMEKNVHNQLKCLFLLQSLNDRCCWNREAGTTIASDLPWKCPACTQRTRSIQKAAKTFKNNLEIFKLSF